MHVDLVERVLVGLKSSLPLSLGGQGGLLIKTMSFCNKWNCQPGCLAASTTPETEVSSKWEKFQLWANYPFKSTGVCVVVMETEGRGGGGQRWKGWDGDDISWSRIQRLGLFFISHLKLLFSPSLQYRLKLQNIKLSNQMRLLHWPLVHETLY